MAEEVRHRQFVPPNDIKPLLITTANYVSVESAFKNSRFYNVIFDAIKSRRKLAILKVSKLG